MSEIFDEAVQINGTGPKKIVLDAQNSKISITGVARMPTPTHPTIEGGHIEIDAVKLEIVLRDGIFEGANEFIIKFNKGQLQIGNDVKIGSGNNQILFLRNKNNNETIRAYGHGVLAVGGLGNNGRIYLADSNKNDNIVIHSDPRSNLGDRGNIEVWGESDDGSRRYQSLYFNAKHSLLRVGADNESGGIIVQGPNGIEINIDGNTGDIRLAGGDCAEQFDVVKGIEMEPGTVVVFDDEAKMCPCSKIYDKRVAGIVSGANGLNPGIILGNSTKKKQRVPIALNGKTYCKVDASKAPIEIGDLLTTSNTYGHAMKATDRAMAFGAVFGKAMEKLYEGTGLIPALVALH